MMHAITERILKQRDALTSAYIAGPLDDGFAIMLSYVEANEFYQDLLVAPGGFEVYYYKDLTQPPGRRHFNFPHLGRPPTPSRDHNIWCSFEGITLIIKGMKDE